MRRLMSPVESLWGLIDPILQRSPPAVALAGVIAMAGFNFSVKRRASDNKETARDFKHKRQYSKSEKASKVGLSLIVLLTIPYTISAAGMINLFANLVIIALGVGWVISTITSIFFL